MSSYFDEKSSLVRDAATDFAKGATTVTEFLSRVEEIEELVITDVTLNTGDREFPDDLREKILGIIATMRCKDTTGVETKGRKIVLMMRYSPMIDELHSAYHEVALRRAKFRNTYYWSDDPRANLKLRDEIDESL